MTFANILWLQYTQMDNMLCDLQHETVHWAFISGVPCLRSFTLLLFSYLQKGNKQFGFHKLCVHRNTLEEADHVTHPCVGSTPRCRSRCSFQSVLSPGSTAASCSRCLKKLWAEEKQTNGLKHTQSNVRHTSSVTSFFFLQRKSPFFFSYEESFNLLCIALALIGAVLLLISYISHDSTGA